MYEDESPRKPLEIKTPSQLGYEELPIEIKRDKLGFGISI